MKMKSHKRFDLDLLKDEYSKDASGHDIGFTFMPASLANHGSRTLYRLD